MVGYGVHAIHNICTNTVYYGSAKVGWLSLFCNDLIYFLSVQDGRQEPRGGHTSRVLPNPRWMSQRNHPDEDLPDTRYTHMVMQFGQFLDHDMTLTPKDGISC